SESGSSSRWVKTVICGSAVALAAWLSVPSRASSNLDTGQKSVPTDGARIYADNCVECHAADGHGLMLHQPNFKDPDWQATVTDQELSRVIKWGREPMPFWVGALSDEQIESVVKFIRTLGRPRAATVLREPVKAAPNQQAAEAQKQGAATSAQ